MILGRTQPLASPCPTDPAAITGRPESCLCEDLAGTDSLIRASRVGGPGGGAMGLRIRGRRRDGPPRTIGIGLGTAYAGFGLDLYIHEIGQAVADAESIWSLAHVPIFLGMGIVATGLPWALLRAAVPPP